MMREHEFAKINKDEELQVYHYGMEQCKSSHSYGPSVRDHFLVHFVLRGSGFFKVGDKVYSLSANQAFLITPDIVTYYQADIDEPWTYCWIGFNGIKAYTLLKDAGFTYKNPILTYDGTSSIPYLMEEVLGTDINIPGYSLKVKGLLYMILSEIQRVNCSGRDLGEHKKYKEIYVEKAVEYIERNYSRYISVSDIVNHIGLDRSYFSTIFKESLNVPPREYLINFRMSKAAQLLKSTDLTIGDIARSTGYSDPLCFSKVFKKIMGVSPLKYRYIQK